MRLRLTVSKFLRELDFFCHCDVCKERFSDYFVNIGFYVETEVERIEK